jgi:ubiquinone/menaquinone biosynthesis C-methylase UbiE
MRARRSHGIDLTEEHHRLAERNFAVHGSSATLVQGDAADLPFPAEFFDIVYSNGVLHCTPDTVRCISEAYRVLKTGGRFIVTMYYTYSAFHLGAILLYRGIVQGDLRRLGYRELMATAENGADGLRIKPLVKTYSKTQLRNMLDDFSKVRVRAAHFRREHLPLGRWLPRSVAPVLEPYLGWYVVGVATK